LIKKLSFILTLLISLSGFAQISDELKEQIEIKSYHIDIDLGKRINKKKIEVDTIKIKSELYTNKIENKIKFKVTREFIDLDIYTENGKLLMIRTTEKSPKFKSYDNAIKITTLYFKNGIKVDQKIRVGIPKELHGIGFPKDFDSHKVYGYDQNFTPKLIMKISNQIIEQTAE
tara:strand:- start:156 stop:674 length:519 start_codon:yes stop_codon:yes gene_type:complete